MEAGTEPPLRETEAAPELSRGFFDALGPSLDDARGALSFMTILA